ncbi:unnamed protein product [Cylindrotheca closterium]|nr:unnamed protein product [Cylindrotheca closterium]
MDLMVELCLEATRRRKERVARLAFHLQVMLETETQEGMIQIMEAQGVILSTIHPMLRYSGVDEVFGKDLQVVKGEAEDRTCVLVGILIEHCGNGAVL